MSLLMEALKKAEEAKRQGAASPAADFSLLTEEAPSEQVLSALAADKQTSTIPPLEFDSLSEISPPPDSQLQPEIRRELPQLPDDLSALDLEFAPQPTRQANFTTELAPPSQSTPRAEPSVRPSEPFHHSIPTQANRNEPANEPPPRGQPSSPTKPPDVALKNDQQSAQNLFQAKQPPHDATSRKRFMAVVGLFSLLGAVSLGIYFWLQLQPKNGMSLMTGNAAKQPMVAAPLPPAPAVTPLPATPVPSAQPPVTPVETTAQKAAEEDAPPPHKEVVKSAPTVVSRPLASNDGPVRITTSRLRLDPALDKGYEAFQRGDLTGAIAAYGSALRNDPNNVDALSGLAMSQLRSGRNDLAEPLFQKVLEIDPRNSLAQSSLANLRAPGDPVQMESRLKTALIDQPDSPNLHFSLGNLYARQNRWADAQQAYFKAMSGDPENPDYLFNLAISLDRLHQAKLARQYYDQALSAAEKRPSGFDRTLASERIRKLQP